uniref:Uncharacterized protein n=1 Tax=Oryza nivara TaxID=4536 RepID=A0A0E0J1U5_ORYNI
MARGSTLLLPQVQVDFLPGQPTKIWLLVLLKVIGGCGAVYKEAKDEGYSLVADSAVYLFLQTTSRVVCCCFY